jgi:pimeloyl-ACP methyl ester carboxylesterase
MPRFESFDGTAISYQDVGPAGGDPPVVLHHGFGSTARLNWVRPGIVAALVATGRRVVALDARGHGGSDKPYQPARYGEGAMARDLGLLIDLLGTGRVDLVGYSMGAVVALITAAGDPRVRRLVAGGIGASAAEVGGFDQRVIPTGELARALLTDDPATVTHPMAGRFRTFVDATRGDRRALAAQATAAHRTRIPLARITAPTLVIAGSDDPLAARPEALAAAIPGARVRTLPGDHLDVVDHPGFTRAIVEFLGGG